jgi:hypothetical protein
MPRSAAHLFFALVLAICLGVTACTDRNPAALPDLPNPTLPPPAMARLTCTVSVRDASLACRPDGAPAASGVSAAIIGGQGSYVRLTSTGVNYDGTSVFRADVTVENLTAQALGTADGVTPSAGGVRVFFSSPPVATEGTGAVEVANADGEDFFTTAAQKFFRYDGILPPGDTSAAREWRFTVPSTVATFTFGVYVAAPVRAEKGWLSLAPLAPSLLAGDTLRMTVIARNVAGGAPDVQPVSWTTSNTAVVTVDAQGLLTGVGPGQATVTATSGERAASVGVHVASAAVYQPALVHFFEVPRASVVAGSGDSLQFRTDYGGPPGFVPYVEIVLRHPSGVERSCREHGPLRTPARYEWGCGMAFSEWSRGGVYRVQQITVAGRTLTHAELLAAGAPAFVYVESPNEDRTPPALSAMTLSPTTVTAGVDRVNIRMTASHDGARASRMDVLVRSQGNPTHQLPGEYLRTENGQTYFQLSWTVPSYYRGGTFVLDSLRVWDANNNVLTLRTAQLAAAGFPNQFTVVATNPDTIPPDITDFGFSPQSVVGNGTDTVTARLTATEAPGASGVRYADVEFEKMGDATRRFCVFSPPSLAVPRWTCKLAFAAGDVGTWRVREIYASDRAGNYRLLRTPEIQAAGFPTELTVTSP